MPCLCIRYSLNLKCRFALQLLLHSLLQPKMHSSPHPYTPRKIPSYLSSLRQSIICSMKMSWHLPLLQSYYNSCPLCLTSIVLYYSTYKMFLLYMKKCLVIYTIFIFRTQHRISQSWYYRHFRPGNSLLLGATLCTVRCLVASFAIK